MAAGKQNSSAITFEIDVTDGGAASTGFVQYLTKIGDIELNRGTVTSTPFGVSASQYLLGVIKDYPAFTIEGFYDTTASTGPNAILNGTHAATRTFTMGFGDSKTVSGECWITNYKRTQAVGEYQGFSATIQPTGTQTEA
jgi:hypothetical protein